ncbi:alpha-amylase family glycosyl hydrolase [Paractinoplanes hotanensis]|uniref:Alpha-amylase family glycosyl hydrolase n=1 Tax=Paractinoplanes hotanensis TaxID=2906497 RepID=A0ABT0XRH9_9ACTN|nr:alpha-amylase family glycosyl hydrolase [Actinoplanes hotanensis]MCM4076371.1 alpha-amylase family glycosyl hydrolase [Actinoplanes hotanensis]
MGFRRVSDIDFDRLTGDRAFHPSPPAWEDEVLYFLMLDRFADGDDTTPLLTEADRDSAWRTAESKQQWQRAGTEWAGGTLAGLRGRLGYLSRLGVTAVWISPILKQAPRTNSYHGYATQNFLEVDPHFGRADELRDLVAEAHGRGIRVILDVVLNHAGDVFAYEEGDVRWDGRTHAVAGFRDADRAPTLPFGPVDPAAGPDAAVWPAELQNPGTFTAKGPISNWDWHPEYLEGDFEGLKDIALGSGPADGYRPSPALRALTRVYQYWIAFADLDGFRVDTVKHMDPGAARYFASAVHEFAQSLGKENFYLIAEITGSREFAYRTLEQVGMDAALGLADVQDQMEWLVKGFRDPREYFGLFRDSLQLGKDSHTWFRNRVVTAFDDHDQVRKGTSKARFAADDLGRKLGVAAIAFNAATLGIPCLYYGSEQGLDGSGPSDRYLREAMFGGEFGAFRSRGAHCFDENSRTYAQVSRILALRRRLPALRRGRQYLRPISGDGVNFGYPQLFGGEMRSVLAWSRLFAGAEVVAAINTDPDHPRTAWVTIDVDLQPAGGKLTCLFSTDPGQEGSQLPIEPRNGKAVEVTVPAAGFVVYG